MSVLRKVPSRTSVTRVLDWALQPTESDEPPSGFQDSDDEQNLSKHNIKQKINFLDSRQCSPRHSTTSPVVEVQHWEQQKDTLAKLILIVKQLNDKWSDELYQKVITMAHKVQQQNNNIDMDALQQLSTKLEELRQEIIVSRVIVSAGTVDMNVITT